MSKTENKILDKKGISILIFIQKITSKNMQDLIFFLQENNFNMKRITKKDMKKYFVLSIKNSNFILESNSHINFHQMRNIIGFLKKSTNINGIFFQNQVLNLKRIENLEEQSQLNFWKKINNFVI